MKPASQSALLRCTLAAGFAIGAATAANAQIPEAIVLDTAVPIIVNAVKPHKGPQQPKFEGTVVNATTAQITVRAKGNDQTFPLAPDASSKMLSIIDKGGYQYGDKVTVYFDPDSKKALKIKGKPSKPS
jgi:hypothetical protein